MSELKPLRRAGYWYLQRRVPVAYRAIDQRGIVQITTGIRIADDPRGIAAAKSIKGLNAWLETYWKDLAAGRTPSDRARYDVARAMAASMGFAYAPGSELQLAPISELVARIEALIAGNRIEEKPAVEAALGGVEKPAFRLSDLPAEYERIQLPELVDMSPNQLRIWRNTPKRVIASLTTITGDIPMASVTRAHALDLRDRWSKRIVDGHCSNNTANRETGTLNKMWRVISDKNRLGLEMVFEGLHIGGRNDKQRTAFHVDVVQDIVLREGMFANINPEARRVIYLICETGLRPAEAVNLTRTTIKLDCDYPHVQVRPDDRRMKTPESWRDVPLVGVALEAMKAQPNGFPRYRDKSSSLSAMVGKAFRVRKIGVPSEDSFDEKNTLYSLRHTFEDRLTVAEAPEKVIATLMGHKHNRPKYGLGPPLDQLTKWLKAIAFRPPGTV